MTKEEKLQNEKEKYRRFYNAVILIAFLIMISLVITIPATYKMIAADPKNELQDNSTKSESIESEKAYYTDKRINKTLEPKYYVIVERIKEGNEDYIKSYENLIYPDLTLKGGSDTSKYNLVYVNEDGKVIRSETIKGIVWNFFE